MTQPDDPRSEARQRLLFGAMVDFMRRQSGPDRQADRPAAGLFNRQETPQEAPGANTDPEATRGDSGGRP